MLVEGLQTKVGTLEKIQHLFWQTIGSSNAKATIGKIDSILDALQAKAGALQETFDRRTSTGDVADDSWKTVGRVNEQELEVQYLFLHLADLLDDHLSLQGPVGCDAVALLLDLIQDVDGILGVQIVHLPQDRIEFGLDCKVKNVLDGLQTVLVIAEEVQYALPAVSIT